MALEDFEIIRIPSFDRSKSYAVTEHDVPFGEDQLEAILNQAGFVWLGTLDMNASDQSGKARFPYLSTFMNKDLWRARG